MGIELGKSRVPDGLRVYAVGDVHGCFDEMRWLLAMIEYDLADHPVDDYRIVFLGDYMDRGPHSKEVLSHLMALCERDPRVICLCGNHDEMLLTFMTDPFNRTDPLKRGQMYFRNGIATTLKSYGARLDENNLTEEMIRDLPVTMNTLISGFHFHFLRNLPRTASIGDYFFCHAGIRPGVALDDQDDKDLIWIRGDFLEYEKPFEKVVIHGHTSRDKVEVRSNRINIDTKCHQSGILTSVVLEGADHRFLQTG